jgi:hypothetical protein
MAQGMELTTPHTVFQVCFRIALWRFLYILMTNGNKALSKPLRVAGRALFA